MAAASATATRTSRSTAIAATSRPRPSQLLKRTASTKFDETVELHIRLGLNVRHAEQQLRGTLPLPHGLGKDVSVAVFAKGDAARGRDEAGADFVGADDLAERVEGGWTDFDVAIATPDMMSTVGKLGRILGPQGKMPNPKVGTVTGRRRQGGRGVEGREGRVPDRPPGDRPPHDRQGELRRAQPARELRGGDRGDRPRAAGRRQGPLHPLGHGDDDDGPGHPRRPVPSERSRDRHRFERRRRRARGDQVRRGRGAGSA